MPITVHALPEDFDVFAADDAALAAAHLPPRALLGKLYKPGTTFIEPLVRERPERRHGPRRRGVKAAAEVSSNWSGAVVYAPAGEAFGSVSSQWTVPNVDARATGSWFYAASWIGIDGDGSDDVCQIGVETDAYRTKRAGVETSISAWFEWYPAPEHTITNLAVRAGDFVSMMIVTDGPGATSATAYISNLTTGVALAPFEFAAPAGTALGGNCAEWILEAPSVDGGQSAVADYGSLFFTACEAAVLPGGAEESPADTIDLEAASGAIESSATVVAGNLVWCVYAGASP